MGLEEVKEKRRGVQKDFHKEDPQNPRGLAIIKLRLFFPLAEHEHEDSGEFPGGRSYSTCLKHLSMGCRL